MKLARRVLDGLGSFWLACALLLNLLLLTLFGTLYQVHGGLFEAQKRYFESWYVAQSTPVPLVLPGGLFCMGLLAINLFLGGFVRIRKSAATVGVIVVHCGIALLLASGFVKLAFSDDGHLTLSEHEASDEYVSYFLWEVAIWDTSEKGPTKELLIPHDQIVDLSAGRVRTFTSAALPFDIELSGYLRNCRPMPKGPNWVAASPTVEGYALLEGEPENDAEKNWAGLTARFRDRSSGQSAQSLLWGFERYPSTFSAGGKTWAINLRHKRYSMPFTIRLDDFRKIDHPGMSLAKSFESDVTKFEAGAQEKIRIQMNEPLRHGGLVLFQSGFDERIPAGEREISVFSVVRNPSDYWPLYSCIVIGVGLLLTFTPKLARFVRTQNQRRNAPPSGGDASGDRRKTPARAAVPTR